MPVWKLQELVRAAECSTVHRCQEGWWFTPRRAFHLLGRKAGFCGTPFLLATLLKPWDTSGLLVQGQFCLLSEPWDSEWGQSKPQFWRPWTGAARTPNGCIHPQTWSGAPWGAPWRLGLGALAVSWPFHLGQARAAAPFSCPPLLVPPACDSPTAILFRFSRGFFTSRICSRRP